MLKPWIIADNICPDNFPGICKKKEEIADPIESCPSADSFGLSGFCKCAWVCLSTADVMDSMGDFSGHYDKGELRSQNPGVVFKPDGVFATGMAWLSLKWRFIAH